MGKAKKLPDHIKDIINNYGQDIVKDSRLSSILNDIASFDDVPAAKLVLRTLLKGGYGARLLEIGNSTKDWQLCVTAFVSEISNKYGFQQDIVDYLLSSIVYGLGWINKMPSYNGVIQPRKINANSRREYALSDLKGELVSQKKEYEHLLASLLVKPAKTCAYYPASALTKLGLVEGKIRLLCEALKIDDSGWCEKAKEKILNAHYKDNSSLKKKTYSMIAVIAAVAIICGAYGTSYVNSLREIESYKKTVQKGDTFMASGLYDQAIASYKDAYTNYDAINSSKYKNEAFQKMGEVTDRLIEAGKTDNMSLLAAKQAIQSELQLNLSSSDRSNLQEKLQNVEVEINNRVESGRNTLILNVSANSGKLNSDGRKLLDELLEFLPNDYWLNFIKNKDK